MTLPKLNTQTKWRGEAHGFQFSIVHWGEDQNINEGKGVWNYYVYISERRAKEKFAELWLEPKLNKIVETAPGFVSYDYYNTPVANVHWHGGPTYYAKHGELEGHRSVEFGCDYNHLWDMEGGYMTEIEDVVYDVLKTCEELNELYPQDVK